ncbi:sulfatase [Candidatus Eisenbacteria bacterium]|uniref:Sulfatase n=1 Tax=Eiseniibacteriota bacterium TaxID=2212470 RepID=A0ABV6YLE6_UNCEI
MRFRRLLATFPPRFAGVLVVFVATCLALSCFGCDRQPKIERPNVLWILWDTVRSDRMSLYGYDKQTTPFLAEWSQEARVFDDCIAAANYTLPSHASMFTGLLPSEHGSRNGYPRLDSNFTTVAELFQDSGYRTFLYSANPHISERGGFAQGFDLAEHPWIPKYRKRAIDIVAGKIVPEDKSSELPEKIRRAQLGPWDVKASGELAQQATREWLQGSDSDKPFFVFLNYMEAHRPYIPPERYRQRVMTPKQIPQSYAVERTFIRLWSYTFGLNEYTQDELDVMSATYDATLAELDDLLRNLLVTLEADGHLDNTIVVLASDHGEHLGEHHMMGHQYSLYNPLVCVPLVVHYPKRLAAGRDARPVMNYDLFPTLLDLAGIAAPEGLRSTAVNLLSPLENRVRLAESLGPFTDPLQGIQSRHPAWDPTPWTRELRALFDGEFKLIQYSDGERRLYRFRDDPEELDDLTLRESVRSQEMAAAMVQYVEVLAAASPSDEPLPEMTEEQRELLRSLGYVSTTSEPDSMPPDSTRSK